MRSITRLIANKRNAIDKNIQLMLYLVFRVRLSATIAAIICSKMDISNAIFIFSQKYRKDIKKYILR